MLLLMFNSHTLNANIPLKTASSSLFCIIPNFQSTPPHILMSLKKKYVKFPVVTSVLSIELTSQVSVGCDHVEF